MFTLAKTKDHKSIEKSGKADRLDHSFIQYSSNPMKKIPIGISSCLLGQNVRFDGGHKRDSYITGTLSEYFDFHPFCPEVEIGLGTPRPTIHLVKIDNAIRCVGIKDPEMDVTERLRNRAEYQKDLHADLCGYILKKDSPSCGMERVKVYAGGSTAQRWGRHLCPGNDAQ